MLRKSFSIILKPIVRPYTLNLLKSTCHYSTTEKSVLADPGLKKPDPPEKHQLQSVLTLQQTVTLDSIQKLRTSKDVINFLRNNEKLIVPLYAPLFSQIFRVMQSNSSDMSKELLIKNPEFENFCRTVRKSARAIRPSDILTILKTLKLMKISMNSMLCQTLLQVLTKSINELNINQLMFINFMICKAPTSPIVEALKISIPIVFDANVRAKLNYGNPKSVVEALNYSFNESRTFNSSEIVVEAALSLRDEFTFDQCKDIVFSFLFNKVKPSTRPRRELYTFCLAKVKEEMMENMPSNEIIRLASFVVNSFLFADAFYYDEVILMNATKYVLTHNLNLVEAGKLLRAYSRISYVDLDFLNYIDNLLSKTADLEKMPDGVMTILSFISSCSDVRYLPPKWHTYENAIINHFLNMEEVNIPLIRVTLELAALGRWHVSLINKVFSEDFLKDYLKRKNNKLDYLTTLNLYQAVKASKRDDILLPPVDVIEIAKKEIKSIERELSLAPVLELLFGGKSYVINEVLSKDGHFIDHLVVLNKSGHALPIRKEGVEDGQNLESISLPTTGYTFAVFSLSPTSYCIDGIKLRGKFKLYIETMTTHGVIPVPISKTIWDSLEDSEKLPYLKREIFSRVPGNDSSEIFEQVSVE